ncbi:MAG TPA: 4-alpha-glucanotransferase [Ktedonobacterales bacterium]|nr:4-alpha-glucanotransferase [Ktedonobacterales bacterium]
MKWPRAGGILIHPTSLPGPFGIGDFGPAANVLLDFLATARQTLWQVLPLGPTGYGNSPYAILSAFAGNPLLISPERLVEEDLLAAGDVMNLPAFPGDRVDFGAVISWKMALLRRSHLRFVTSASAVTRHDYEQFCEAQRSWLDDYALFAALKAEHGGAAWVHWDESLATRNPAALMEARRRLGSEIAFQKYAQFIFFHQWSAVRAAAHERGIFIVGDLAIFVAHDSADVWAHPELYQLDARGNPTVVAGVPPDYFSETGQRWGNPLYRWDVLQETDYAWWIERVRRALDLYDMIRLDHFRGFHAYWEVPASCETAIEGHWVSGPADTLFSAIADALGDVPLIAEDLGQITPGVRALRKRLGFPSMKVLQFAFSADARRSHLPHNFTRDIIVYTGTHDNDTTYAWFESRTGHERTHILRYLGCEPDDVVPAMIRAAFASVANLAVVPMQDVLGLGTEARMNFPSRADGNWEWRMTAGQLTPQVAEWLASLATLFGRT